MLELGLNHTKQLKGWHCIARSALPSLYVTRELWSMAVHKILPKLLQSNERGACTTLEVRWRDNVIDLQDHLHQLGGELKLLLLADQGLENVLVTHVCQTQKINIQCKGVRMLQLARSYARRKNGICGGHADTAVQGCVCELR